MAVSGITLSFYCGLGPDEPNSAPQQRAQPLPAPKQKYFDTSVPERPDYSYGSSPPKAGYYSPPRCPSPQKPAEDTSGLSAQERADRAEAVRMFGGPWQPAYTRLLALWRIELQRQAALQPA